MGIKPFCRSCKTPWIEHDGIEITCKKLQKANMALRVISTWATCEGGIALHPEHVAALCDRVLGVENDLPN